MGLDRGVATEITAFWTRLFDSLAAFGLLHNAGQVGPTLLDAVLTGADTAQLEFFRLSKDTFRLRWPDAWAGDQGFAMEF